ncbi:MAG TPA: hypothetical protein VH592_02130 [Gemmataceae bacterium]|jgi:hypothetical protein
MITSIVVVTVLIAFGASGAARADCGPNVTYYAPYPYWFPKYFGPPYSDYQVVQYVTPPEVTAMVVKQRILAINATNPALLPAPKDTLPLPTPEVLPPPQK